MCALTFVLTIKCIAFTTCVSSKLFKDRKKQSLVSIPSFRITFARFAAIWSITSADIPTITVKSICFPFSNLCVRGETLKIGSIRMFCLTDCGCFSYILSFPPNSRRICPYNALLLVILHDDRFIEPILAVALNNPISENIYCLP